MEKQKICIIGGGLTGLVTAISLSKLNISIDLIIGDRKLNQKSQRTVAISQDNLNFLNTLNISQTLKKNVWPCNAIELYSENSNKNKDFLKILRLNKKIKQNILYMIKNDEVRDLLISKIKKIKSISIISNKKVSKFKNSGLLKEIIIGKKIYKYSLIIVCVGNNSSLVKNNFSNETLNSAYKETSITTILKHHPIKNSTARQIFLDKGILALLPISRVKTSIVWSVKKNTKNINDLFIKNKVKLYAGQFLKKITFLSKIEQQDLSFLIRKKYYKDRILLFGDTLHQIHPFAGQGFNMTLRDLVNLEKIINKKISLGLDIGSADVLSDFSTKVKSGNFAFSLGINLLKNYFSINNSYFKKARNDILRKVDNNRFLKDIFIHIADKGFKF